MVFLTIVTQRNGETIYFEEPIPIVHFMKLISCSLYNSWDALKNEFSATLTEGKKKETAKLLPGHYSLETFATHIENLFAQSKYKLEAKIYQPLGQLVIKNPGVKLIHFDRDLADFLGMRQKQLLFVTFVKKIIFSPTEYFIHCGLIDKQKNIFNGKRADILASFDVKGKPYEKVSYQASPQQVLRDCSTDQSINSITISVKDENGELFDFKGFPLLFELELN